MLQALAIIFIFVFLPGAAVNSHNTGGVASGSEAFHDIKAGVVEGYSKDKFTSFKLND
jgi:hypothetical protein